MLEAETDDERKPWVREEDGWIVCVLLSSVTMDNPLLLHVLEVSETELGTVSHHPPTFIPTTIIDFRDYVSLG